MRIFEAAEYQNAYLRALNRLLPHLSPDAKPLHPKDLRQLIASESSFLFFAAANDNGRISGTLTLIVFTAPTGCRARIEDVVVDPVFRKQGIGKALMECAICRAKTAGAKRVELTSHPSRTAAHGLYEGAGFTVRTTTVYQKMLL